MFDSESNFTPKARIRALTIVQTCCSSIAACEISEYKKAVKHLLKPTLTKWLTLLRTILSLPFGTDYGLRLEALKTFKELVRNFNIYVKKNTDNMVAILLAALQNAYVPMIRSVVNGEAKEDDNYDSDGK